MDDPVLYGELAGWWPVLSDPAGYAEEAGFYARVLEEACSGPHRTMLELGSGGGNNASHMRLRFETTLVDISPGMLEVSRRLNPGSRHVQGDMRTVRLGELFDCVLIHDAVAYMRTPEDLRAAMATAFAHCRRGGAALFCPDYTRESFAEGADSGGGDSGGRSLRYLEWTRDPDPSDTEYLVDFAYMLLDTDGTMRVVQDRHRLGLFAAADWLDAARSEGFEPHWGPAPPGAGTAGSCGVLVGRRTV